MTYSTKIPESLYYPSHNFALIKEFKKTPSHEEP
jgi:hypothetical protein